MLATALQPRHKPRLQRLAPILAHDEHCTAAGRNCTRHDRNRALVYTMGPGVYLLAKTRWKKLNDFSRKCLAGWRIIYVNP
jgi:hypothetical protein